jgi:hypothetical protein
MKFIIIQQGELLMFISYVESAAKGFKKWPATQPVASNDDDRLGGATPVVLADAPLFVAASSQAIRTASS